MEGTGAELIQEYIIGEALILIPVLWVIGYFIKQTPKVPNWVIVWVLAVTGIVGAVAIMGFNADGFIQGILVAGASVLGNQFVKQTKKAGEN